MEHKTKGMPKTEVERLSQKTTKTPRNQARREISVGERYMARHSGSYDNGFKSLLAWNIM